MFNYGIEILENTINRNNDICVIIPTFRSKKATARTVLSLISGNGKAGYDIVLIDGEGYDHGYVLEKAREVGFSDLFYLVLGRNVGAAGAVYAGQKACYECGYEYFVMTDNDAELITAGGIDLLVGSLRRYDIVLPTNIDASKQRLEDRKLGFHGLMHYMTISRDTIDKVGFVNHEYFIAMEDLDYVTRAGSIGLKVAAIQDCLYYHPMRKISLFYNPTIYFTLRNHLMYVFRNPNHVAKRYRLLSLIQLLLYLLIKAAHSVQLRDTSIIKTALMAFRDFMSRSITLDFPENNFTFRAADPRERGDWPRLYDLNKGRNRVFVMRGYRVSDGIGAHSCLRRSARCSGEKGR
jgi:GT2 family glycosyltransferase